MGDGAFFSTWGPTDGPILERDAPPALGVYAASDGGMPIGIAYPVGFVRGDRAPIKAFRLAIGGGPLEGLFICDRRRFVQLGDAAD